MFQTKKSGTPCGASRLFCSAAASCLSDAAAVNYVTKVYKAGGYVTVDGEQTIGYTKGDYNVASKVSRGNTSYTFFGGYNMCRYGGMELEKKEDLFLPIENPSTQRNIPLLYILPEKPAK